MQKQNEKIKQMKSCQIYSKTGPMKIHVPYKLSIICLPERKKEKHVNIKFYKRKLSGFIKYVQKFKN